jgi:replication-associated recombination protein RarA
MEKNGELFKSGAKQLAPLAERIRPKTLGDFVGQNHLTEKDKVVRNILEGGYPC